MAHGILPVGVLGPHLSSKREFAIVIEEKWAWRWSDGRGRFVNIGKKGRKYFLLGKNSQVDTAKESYYKEPVVFFFTLHVLFFLQRRLYVVV